MAPILPAGLGRHLGESAVTTTLHAFRAAVAALILALPAARARAQSATFSVSPASVDFGDQYVGSTFSLDVWLRNDGTAPVTLTVTACEGTSAAFYGYAGPYTI